MRVELRAVEFGYGRTGPLVLRGVDLAVESGSFYGIVGPNGSGKSTLLRVIGGIGKPSAGTVLYDGRDIHSMSPRESARIVAAVPSGELSAFAFTVEQIVLMGRSPYLGLMKSEGRHDNDIVRDAMRRTGVSHLSGRIVTQLSSGERQRVMIARALAQEPRVLLLDEPTAHLDVNYQVEIMELALGLARQSGMTVITVLHDLNLAGRYCDRIAMLNHGQIAAEGAPGEVFTEENLLDVYGVRAVIGSRPDQDRPAIFILSGSPRRHRNEECDGPCEMPVETADPRGGGRND